MIWVGDGTLAGKYKAERIVISYGEEIPKDFLHAKTLEKLKAEKKISDEIPKDVAEARAKEKAVADEKAKNKKAAAGKNK